jgi:hypothetical protein
VSEIQSAKILLFFPVKISIRYPPLGIVQKLAKYVQFLGDDPDQNRDRPIVLRQLTDFDLNATLDNRYL